MGILSLWVRDCGARFKYMVYEPETFTLDALKTSVLVYYCGGKAFSIEQPSLLEAMLPWNETKCQITNDPELQSLMYEFIYKKFNMILMTLHPLPLPFATLPSYHPDTQYVRDRATVEGHTRDDLSQSVNQNMPRPSTNDIITIPYQYNGYEPSRSNSFMLVVEISSGCSGKPDTIDEPTDEEANREGAYENVNTKGPNTNDEGGTDGEHRKDKEAVEEQSNEQGEGTGAQMKDKRHVNEAVEEQEVIEEVEIEEQNHREHDDEDVDTGEVEHETTIHGEKDGEESDLELASDHVEVFESSSDDDDWELPTNYSEESDEMDEDSSESSDEDRGGGRDQRHGDYQGRSAANSEAFEQQNVSAEETDSEVDFDDAASMMGILIFPVLSMIPVMKTLRRQINLQGLSIKIMKMVKLSSVLVTCSDQKNISKLFLKTT